MKFAFIVAVMWVLRASVICDLATRHTNIKCEDLDKSFVEVRVCRLKVLGRGIIGASIHLKVLKLPIKTMKINFSVWRKLSGYHPFLFNTTVDLCRHIKHPNPSNVFFYFYEALKPFFNVNHSCPINHDIILKDFVLHEKMFTVIPFPKGSYMFAIKLITNNVSWATIYSYLDINVDNVL